MKIDLDAVKELATALPQLNSKEHDGVCLSYADCELIADALEQLPKLVFALQSAQSDLEYHFTNVGEQPPSLFEAKQVLEPFTN